MSRWARGEGLGVEAGALEQPAVSSWGLVVERTPVPRTPDLYSIHRKMLVPLMEVTGAESLICFGQRIDPILGP